MTSQETIREWRESTEDAITALQEWRASLAEWERNGGEHDAGDFDAAFNRLYQADLGDWADWNNAGDGLDALNEAVTGREVLG